MQEPTRSLQGANDRHSLSELESSQGAAIVELQGGHGFRSRLAALGFTPGAEVRMLRNLSHGPVIVTIRDTRIVLGRQEAERVLVTTARRDDVSTGT
jgi:ferrous iron transport protein A